MNNSPITVIRVIRPIRGPKPLILSSPVMLKVSANETSNGLFNPVYDCEGEENRDNKNNALGTIQPGKLSFENPVYSFV
jgi:hypothetical protein